MLKSVGGNCKFSNLQLFNKKLVLKNAENQNALESTSALGGIFGLRFAHPLLKLQKTKRVKFWCVYYTSLEPIFKTKINKFVFFHAPLAQFLALQKPETIFGPANMWKNTP